VRMTDVTKILNAIECGDMKATDELPGLRPLLAAPGEYESHRLVTDCANSDEQTTFGR